METLRVKQEQLNDVEKKIAALQTQFTNVTREKTELEDSLELIASRLNRAGRLTKALASEQTRWAETVKVILKQFVKKRGKNANFDGIF